MTHEEWLRCDLHTMLTSLRGKISERKLRLFACACCRRVLHLMDDERSRKAVEVAERHFDNHPGRSHPPKIAEDAHTAAGELYLRSLRAGRGNAKHRAMMAACAANAATAVFQESSVWNYATSGHLAASQASSTSSLATTFAAKTTGAAGRPTAKKERQVHCSLLRDIVGDPFHSVCVDPSWLTSTVRTLVQAERPFDQLPILADALEEAGCTNADIMAHCRGPGPHVRGCWAVDLLLGKE